MKRMQKYDIQLSSTCAQLSSHIHKPINSTSTSSTRHTNTLSEQSPRIQKPPLHANQHNPIDQHIQPDQPHPLDKPIHYLPE
jgi:hypothetical protein